MDDIDKFVEDLIASAPQTILEGHLAGKFERLGVKVPLSEIQRVAALILDGKEGQIDIDGLDSDAVLEFTAEDQRAVIAELEKLHRELPKIVKEIAAKSADQLLKGTKAQWREEGPAQRADIEAFRQRLEARWGKGLDLMRIMLTIVREWFGNRQKALPKNKSKPNLDNVLIRLHARACQVVSEIIVLLENGFADGAMARWRTLHEIAVVAEVIAKYGEDIAERYVLYQIVESYAAMKAYDRDHAVLNHKPLSKAEKLRIRKGYDAILKRFGSSFGEEYGWAAHHLGIKGNGRLNFARLEADVQNERMRSPYKMASYNVHASPKGVYFRLGNLADIPTAGASNAGLTDPAQHTAITFVRLTITVLGESDRLTDLLTAQVLLQLQSMIPTEFWKADKKLRRDDRRHRGAKK